MDFICSLIAKWYELTKLQGFFDPIIARYNLNNIHDIDQFLQAKITEAQMLGLTTSTRPETIRQIIDNFFIMAKALECSTLTYKELHEVVRSQEAQCIRWIKEKARRKIQESYLATFFNHIIPLKIKQLREEHAQLQASGEHLLYSLGELTSFEGVALRCKTKYINIDTYENRPITWDDFIPILSESDYPPKTLSFFQHNLETSSKWAAEQKETITFFEKVMPSVIDQLRQKQSQLSVRGKHSLCFSVDFNLLEQNIKECFEKAKESSNTSLDFNLLEQNIKECFAKAKESSNTSLDFNLLEQNVKECLAKAKASTNTSFAELIANLPSQIKVFFEEEYDQWIKVGRAPEANLILKTWEVATSDLSPTFIEKLLGPESLRVFPTDFWDNVIVRTRINQSDYCQVIESTHSVRSMVQDLIAHPYFSSLSPDTAIEVLTLLTDLLPNFQVYPQSWQRIFEKARREFLAIPPSLQRFFNNLALQQNEEKEGEKDRDKGKDKGKDKDRGEEEEVLQKAHLQKFDDYLRTVRAATKSYSHTFIGPTAYYAAGFLLRRLWAETDQNDPFFEAILDLLLLPSCSQEASAKACRDRESLEFASNFYGGKSRYSKEKEVCIEDPGSIGFASHQPSKGGIFKFSAETGKHSLLTASERWVEMFTMQTLPSKTRLTLLSHALPLLYLQWLGALKALGDYETLQFHPWFIVSLIEKSNDLQNFLSQHLFPTFPDIMLAVRPEIYYVYQQKFEVFQYTKGALRDIRPKRNEVEGGYLSEREFGEKEEGANEKDLGLIEREGVDLDWMPNPKEKQTLRSLLREWDDRWMEYSSAPCLSLDDAATVFFAYFNPNDYGMRISSHVLEIACQFSIDVKKIIPNYWRKNLTLLGDLIKEEADKEVLQLAIALYLGCAVEGVEVKDHSFKISGTTGDIEGLCEIISLFPYISKLDLSCNQIGSLTLFIPTLQKLKKLKKLILQGNPLHNPEPLQGLPDLEVIDIRNTHIHSFSISDLQSPEKSVPPPFRNLKKLIAEALEVIEDNHNSLIGQLSRFLEKKDQTPDKIISLVEQIAENFWDETLALTLKHQTLRSENKINELFDFLSIYDPRESALKLAFALKFKLPLGTRSQELRFHKNAVTKEASCLSQLTISEFPVELAFLKTPNGQILFDHLTHLSLIEAKLTKLDDLPRIPTLQYLDLRDNAITSLSGLRLGFAYEGNIKFPNLLVLNLAKNQLKTDKGLNFILELSFLQDLNMSENHLTAVPGLRNYKIKKKQNTLKFLDLRYNDIKDKDLVKYKNSDNFFYEPQRRKE